MAEQAATTMSNCVLHRLLQSTNAVLSL